MVALYQYFGYDLPRKERFAMIRAAGFDALGVWCDDWFGWSNHREFPKLAREAGLQVVDGHAPFARDYDFVNSLWLDNLDGETTFEIYLRTIDECGEDDIANLIVHPYDLKTQAPPPNEVGLERIKRMLGRAEEHNVTLAFENIRNDEYLEYIFKNASSPKLGFCYDAGHRNCFAPHLDFLEMYGDKLVALHLQDNDGSGDQHLVPFEGKIDWAEQMAKIAATGYAGPTTLECTTGKPGSAEGGGMPPEEWLRNTFEVAKRLETLMK